MMTHLFFVDDDLIFFKANPKNCDYIKHNLISYENTSGQQIKFDKLAITFSRHTHRHHIHYIKDCLNLKEYNGHDLYLDFPTFSLRNKRVQFGYL